MPYGTVGGQKAVGVQAAARIFFDKPARELTLPEAALLAGLPQAPSHYNPFLDPGAAHGAPQRGPAADGRRGLHHAGRGRRGAAQRRSASSRARYYTKRRESYFFDYVKQQLIDEYGARRACARAGCSVYTTLDLKLQQARAQGDRDGLLDRARPARRRSSRSTRTTGYIKAMASSPRYGDSKFNLAAQGHRQPGSTFKVMVLMAALRAASTPTARPTTRSR